MGIKIIQYGNVTRHWFQKMLALEYEVWPKSDPSYLPMEYIQSIYTDTEDVCFYAIDEEKDELAGYFTVIFITEENFNEYLKSRDFKVLKNIGIKQGNNIMYLFTVNIAKKYQGSNCMKKIGIEFVKWLESKEKEGYYIKDVYAEAVTVDGARTLTKGFGMKAMKDVNEEGLGHYYSEDRLKSYCVKMHRYM